MNNTATTQRIPIANIYYLLCYAWDVLKETREEIFVGVTDITDNARLQDLFARVLLTGTRAQIRRGLERGYQPRQDEIAGIRGRLLLSQTCRRNLQAHARAACEWDELEFDTLPNRILKTTLCELRASENLDPRLRDETQDLLRWFSTVQTITRLTPGHFSRVQLHGNNRAYAFLLNICELVHEQMLPEEHGQGRRFRDFERDALPALFEEFVRNFYRQELPHGWEVEAHRFKWAWQDYNDDAQKYLPDMQTDVCLLNRDKQRAIILDTKFYANALATGQYGTMRLHAGNLYQLNTYLRQRSHEQDWKAAEGVLLYPKTDTEIDASFTTDGHRIRALTIDLYQPWQSIAEKLKSIAQPPPPPRTPA